MEISDHSLVAHLPGQARMLDKKVWLTVSALIQSKGVLSG